MNPVDVRVGLRSDIPMRLQGKNAVRFFRGAPISRSANVHVGNGLTEIIRNAERQTVEARGIKAPIRTCRYRHHSDYCGEIPFSMGSIAFRLDNQLAAAPRVSSAQECSILSFGVFLT